MASRFALQSSYQRLRSPTVGYNAPGTRASRLLLPLLMALVKLPASLAAPMTIFDEVDPKPANDPSLWAYLGTAVALVLLGGVFAGLTIALMGQDEIYLQVIATSGEGAERKQAEKVLNLIKRGKHWLLVSLLLGNVITNETLPIVLDHSLGGGWPAVLASTVLIVIFGEIAPQSVCVRYGLPIGAWCAPLVYVLMIVLSPISWPTAKLLDYLLGEDHGTMYKKSGLKTLVTLHRTLGESPAERLNKDEVTIISAVLDLKDKPIGNIMTPIEDVFTLALDTVLDDAMVNKILVEGYSRIPVYAVGNPRDFVGMLLVKMLITYDPEDCLRLRDFQLATLPETRKETSCLDIVNFFQEGKSHMVLVSDYPGEPRGALGVVTLEDVIEELIGEEIVDESDIFVDVHKAIRRMQPAPFNRFRRAEKGEIVTDPDIQVPDTEQEGEMDIDRHSIRSHRSDTRRGSNTELSKSPTARSTFVRRKSSGGGEPVSVRSDTQEMRQHLRAHLEPSNLASRPKITKIGSVKIKPGVNYMSALPENRELSTNGKRPAPLRVASNATGTSDKSIATETTGLLSAGKPAKDGAHAVGYGSLSTSPSAKGDIAISALLKAQANGGPSTSGLQQVAEEEGDEQNDSVSPKVQVAVPQEDSRSLKGSSALSTSNGDAVQIPPKLILDLGISRENLTALGSVHDEESDGEPTSSKGKDKDGNSSKGEGQKPDSRRGSQQSDSTVASLPLEDFESAGKTPRARSGSIMEQVVEVRGVKKMILETTSSSDDEQDADSKMSASLEVKDANGDEGADGSAADGGKKKKRKKRGGKKKKERNAAKGDENSPLLGGS